MLFLNFTLFKKKEQNSLNFRTDKSISLFPGKRCFGMIKWAESLGRRHFKAQEDRETGGGGGEKSQRWGRVSEKDGHEVGSYSGQVWFYAVGGLRSEESELRARQPVPAALSVRKCPSRAPHFQQRRHLPRCPTAVS